MKRLFVFWFLLSFILITIPANLQGEMAKGEEISNQIDFSPSTNQLIIKFIDEVAENNLLVMDLGNGLPVLSIAAGLPIIYVREMALNSHVVKLPTKLLPEDLEDIFVALKQLPGIAWIEPDRILTTIAEPLHAPLLPTIIPNDTRWGEMWNLRYIPGTEEGLNMVPAWDIYTGSVNTIVAVIDTGILPHNDLAGKTVPGYDFISDELVANDGGGRDSDPSDPGDWITYEESTQPGYFQGCPVSDSSWHGTHVAGIIAATSNNNHDFCSGIVT